MSGVAVLPSMKDGHKNYDSARTFSEVASMMHCSLARVQPFCPRCLIWYCLYRSQTCYTTHTNRHRVEEESHESYEKTDDQELEQAHLVVVP